MPSDSDFTKLTSFELDRLKKADEEIKSDETVDHSMIDWD